MGREEEAAADNFLMRGAQSEEQAACQDKLDTKFGICPCFDKCSSKTKCFPPTRKEWTRMTILAGLNFQKDRNFQSD